MELTAIPVADGLLPQADGGLMRGVFVDPFTAGMLHSSGVDAPVFLAPLSNDDGKLFPVGVIGHIEALWISQVFMGSPPESRQALFCVVSGQGRARCSGFEMRGATLIADNVKSVDFDKLRDMGHAIVCGSGWSPVGGSTDQRPEGDLEVVINGFDVSDGSDVEMNGYLRGLVTEYQAHTIEHGMIRSLRQYGVCTARSLYRSIQYESAELRASMDMGFALEVPEVFGVTQSGQCGNPLTSYARFFLARELADKLKKGESVVESLEKARKKTLSELSDVLRVDTDAGLRVAQGLYRGMRHDDTPLTISLLNRVLTRFPRDPF